MAQPNKNNLTESHLALHQESYTSDLKLQTTWAEQVVREESIQMFHSQDGRLHASGHGSLAQTNNPMNQATSEQTTCPQQLDNSLKLFSREGKERIDDPVQRFLTPGSSEPRLFAKPALKESNIPFGSMETVEAREQMARANVEALRVNRKNHKDEKVQGEVDGDPSSLEIGINSD